MAYDVFISFKNTAPGGGLTLDRTIAERLHLTMKNEGLDVFFSEKDLSTTEFMDEIYKALDEAKLLVLVGTSVEHINSEWVKSEWSTFFGSMKSGRKPDSHIMTVLSGISTRDLPIQLEHFESFDARDIDGAVDFAFRTLGKVKKSEAVARIAEEQERQRREAEEKAIREMQLRMEAERQAEKERQAAERKRQRALESAERERQKRISAEKKAEAAQASSSKQAAKSRVLGIVAAVLCAMLVIGGGVGLYSYLQQKAEVARLEEEARTAEEQRLAEVARRDPEPKTEADRALAEIFDFEWGDEGFTITGYKGEGGDVTLPGEYNGSPVTGIGEELFYHNGDLTGVVIPEEVTSIGRMAFCGCSKLSFAEIGGNVKTIDELAFFKCESLTDINIPDSVTLIGKEAFAYSNISSITIPEYLTSIGKSAFAFTNISSISIPEGLTIINDRAFIDCNNLSEVKLPDSLTSIGFESFKNCSKLKSITIPKGMTSIGNNAFAGCHITITAPHPYKYYSVIGDAYKGRIGLDVTWIVEE